MKNRILSSFCPTTLSILLILCLSREAARADLATYFDESTLPTNLFLDVPSASVGTITLQTDIHKLLFYGPGADLWYSRNNLPYAWTPIPSVGIGGVWEAETEVEYHDSASYGRIVGMTTYSGPDGSGGANMGQEFTFGLDHWDSPNGVWVQGLGDNRPGDSGNLSAALNTNKVSLKMAVSRTQRGRKNYRFFYRLATNDTWASLGAINTSDTHTRVALFFKGGAMNVTFNRFLVTTVAAGEQYGFTTNADDTVTITEYAGAGGSVVVPEQLGGLPVSAIGGYVFDNCTGLTSVTLPDGVASLGDNAFRNCTGLTNAVLPSGLTTLGTGAFSGCSSLTRLAIPNGVTTLSDQAFLCCSSLTNVAIPDGVASIGAYAFYGCSALTAVAIPDSVTAIGSAAFCGCAHLAGATIPPGVTTLSDQVFQSCTSLTNIVIPDGVTAIGANAFYDCSALTSIAVPTSVASVGDYAFGNCTSLTNAAVASSEVVLGSAVFYSSTSLTSVQLPAGLTALGSYLFYGCASLTSFVIPNGVTAISDGAFNGTGLTNVVFHSGVTSIGYNAFENCQALTRLTIPSSVTWVGDCAFNWCTSLTSVTLPGGLTSLPMDMFGYCFSLTAVYFLGDAPYADWSTFECDGGIVFYCRPGTSGWSDLSNNTGFPTVLWNPSIQAGSLGFGPIKGGYYFNIAGIPGIPIQVEASTNLTGGAWTPLLTTTLTGGSLDFTDEAYRSYPVRFYRLVGP